MAKKSTDNIARLERLQDRKERFYAQQRADKASDRVERQKERELRENTARNRAQIGQFLQNADFNGFMRVFGFIFGNLLLFGLIAQLTGTETNTRTFAGFLEFLGKGTWTIPLDWLNWSSITVGGNWGVFEFFREFIQLIIAGVNAFVWLGVMILNVLGFITQFAFWLFGFVA